jgi:hypothetical protein
MVGAEHRTRRIAGVSLKDQRSAACGYVQREKLFGQRQFFFSGQATIRPLVLRHGFLKTGQLADDIFQHIEALIGNRRPVLFQLSN